MQDRVKDIALTVVFALIIGVIAIANVIVPDSEISEAERRKLASFPQLSLESAFTSDFYISVDEYAADQFVLRDSFRALKALTQLCAFQRLDNNDVYVQNGHLAKLEYPLNEHAVIQVANAINRVLSDYLDGMNVYYSIVPDKNYYLAAQSGRPSLDYDALARIARENISPDITYIDLFDSLDITCYFNTDSHWRIERLESVVGKLAAGMGFESDFRMEDYDLHSITGFRGVYYGQAALPFPGEELCYLVDDSTRNAIVTDLESGKQLPVYTLDEFDNVDPYDVYLSGASPLLSIKSGDSATQKRLIVFRDSFGSSLAPLLLGEYERIDLVDLRYVSADVIGEYLDFDGDADVLFLYSATLYNSSGILR
ncbi:MAG: DHHW family protein [Clostridia bacterium]|nr:DHHW family protein [Clostridia bacterium]